VADGITALRSPAAACRFSADVNAGAIGSIGRGLEKRPIHASAAEADNQRKDEVT
jgi:hypothetical protein